MSELRSLSGDSEENTGLKIKLLMPWEECVSNQENQKTIKEFIFELSKNELLLQRELDELEFDFNFDRTLYSYQAVMMMKQDANLAKAHDSIVPDLCSDDSFWRNYFYEIEVKFRELKERSSIGAELSIDEK
jgi:hypothetical protein